MTRFKKGESYITLRNFKTNEFYKETVTGYYFTVFMKDGLKNNLFIHKTNDGWQVDSPLCGAKIVSGESSRKSAYEKVIDMMGRITNERYMEFIRRSEEIINNNEDTTRVRVYD